MRYAAGVRGGKLVLTLKYHEIVGSFIYLQSEIDDTAPT